MPRVKQKATITSLDAISELSKGIEKQVKTPNIYGYQPHPKQLHFHNSPTKITLYIGGNRSGKTTAGITEDIWRCQGQHPYKVVPPPPIRGRYIAVDFLDGVDQVALPQFSRWCPLSWLRGGSWYSAYDSYDRILYFENGSELKFMSYEQDTEKFSGASQHFIHCDEEPPQDIYTENIARLLDTKGPMFITMTPVEGMTWLYDKVYEPGILKQNPNITVIEVDITENPYISEGEIQIFITTLDEDEKSARIHGKYVSRGGLIYKGFTPALHVIDSFDYTDKELLIAAGLDHGFNNPTAINWFAVDKDERIVQFHEHYKSGWTVDRHAKQYLEINQQLHINPEYIIGDPSIRNTQSITGTSISEEYAQNGVYIILGNNAVKDGIVRVARFLAKRGDGQPGLRVTKDCKNTIREYSRYRWKTYQSKKVQHDNNALEIPQKKDDHSMDATRYFIMSRPDLTPGVLAEKQPRQNPMGMATVATDIDEDLARRIREGNAYNSQSHVNQDGVYAHMGAETKWLIADNIEGEW